MSVTKIPSCPHCHMGPVNWVRDGLCDRCTEEDRLRTALEAATSAKDGAYRERDRVVALVARMALAAGWRAGLRRHEPDPDPTWDEDWKNVVAIDLPSGQVTWHFHDSERPLFHSLPAYPASWDGHDTPEKYRRVNAALSSVPGRTPEREEATRECGCINAEMVALIRQITDEHGAAGVPFLDDAVRHAIATARALAVPGRTETTPDARRERLALLEGLRIEAASLVKRLHGQDVVQRLAIALDLVDTVRPASPGTREDAATGGEK